MLVAVHTETDEVVLSSAGVDVLLVKYKVLIYYSNLHTGQFHCTDL